MAELIIAVTGAGGRLGRFIVPKLEASGYTIRSLSEVYTYGLCTKNFRPFLRGCHGLVHCAFAHLPGKYRGGEGDDPETFWDLNYNATKRLLEDARSERLNRAILFSSRAIFGDAQVLPAKPNPDTLYGKLKLSIETLALNVSDTKFPIVTLRPTGVYGGEAKINKWTPIFEKALLGSLPSINPITTEVSGRTVAEAVALSLSQTGNSMAGQIYNLSDAKVSLQQILSFAGFDTDTMPFSTKLKGPELPNDRLQELGLVFPGLPGIISAAQELYAELTV